MAERRTEPLEYADPDRQPKPRFAIYWGGWVLLALVTVLAVAYSLQWI